MRKGLRRRRLSEPLTKGRGYLSWLRPFPIEGSPTACGQKQPGLPQEHATKAPRAADTPNFANHKIKRLILELPPTNGPEP
jgi:hypothetical protein